MRTNWILSTAVVAVSITAAIGAQSMKATETPSADDAMIMRYTGCVETVNHGAMFLLTKVESVGAESMHGDMAMKHHDNMRKKGDAATTMQHEEASMADGKMDMMPSRSFALAGAATWSKHVGQTVSVTGSVSDASMKTTRQGVSTLTVKTLKVIAKSCS